MSSNVLFVDDDENLRSSIARVFRKEPYRLFTAASGEEALRLLRTIQFQVIVTDQKMPGLCGTELLELVGEIQPNVIKLMLSGEGTFEIAVKAINNGGVFRYFPKPCNEIELAMSIREAIEEHERREHSRKLLEAERAKDDVQAELENTYPGISIVEKLPSGVLIVEEHELDSIIREFQQENESGEQ